MDEDCVIVEGLLCYYNGGPQKEISPNPNRRNLKNARYLPNSRKQLLYQAFELRNYIGLVGQCLDWHILLYLES